MISQKKLLERLDKMLEEGINGTFAESSYDESELSRLEAKWYRYLTSSKLAYQKTKEEQGRIQEMVSDVSHQTKTPLANILLYADLLREQNLDETSRKLVEEIRQQSEKLDFLIQSLVKTSRLEAGTIQLTQVKNDLGPMVEAALGQIRPKADAKKISLCYEKPDGGKVLLCEEKQDAGKVSLCEEKSDAGKVLLCEEKSDVGMISLRGEKQACVAKYDPKWTQEAVFNLLDNAVKYSPEGSEITVSMQEYEMFSCISISDQGIGIPEEEQPLIFGRFYRGSEVREQSGVGIGLYLTRQIIEGQGGYVTVRSEMGRGSTFQVYLPR